MLNDNCDYVSIYRISNELADTLHCDRFGSCVHFAELFVEKIYNYNIELLNCFSVIEGYVNTRLNDGIPQQHTWILLNNDSIIDPTFVQFSKFDETASYSKKIKNKYTGLEYYEKRNEDSWFSERRKKFPSHVYKNINEEIKRIKRLM